MNGTGLIICLASAALVVSCGFAMAQTTEAAAASQAIAIVGGGGGSGGGNNPQFVATTPDAIAPSSGNAAGAGSCMVPATSDSVSALFVAYSGARWALDEGCERRADADMLVTIAYARAEIFGDAAGAMRNIDRAERRMTSTSAEWVASVDADAPWPEPMRP